MNDGAMKTVESMWVDIWCMLDWIVAQHCRNAFPWHELLNSWVHKMRWEKVMRWHFGKGGVWGGIVRWHGRTDARVVKCQGGRFPVLFKGGERRVRPRFHLFVSYASQQNEGA